MSLEIAIKIGSITIKKPQARMYLHYYSGRKVKRVIKIVNPELRKKLGVSKSHEYDSLTIEGDTESFLRESKEKLLAFVNDKLITKPKKEVTPEVKTPELITEKEDNAAPENEFIPIVLQGRFLSSGMKTRKKINAKKSTPEKTVYKSFPQYQVNLFDFSLNVETLIWGADLERAVRESGVQEGESVKLIDHGIKMVNITKTIQGSNGPEKVTIPKPKKIFSIEKI